jgi:hypothetical protein
VVTTNVSFNGGSLLAIGNASLTATRQLSLGPAGGTLDATSGNTLTVNGPIIGPGALSKGSNSGTVILAASNTYAADKPGGRFADHFNQLLQRHDVNHRRPSAGDRGRHQQHRRRQYEDSRPHDHRRGRAGSDQQRADHRLHQLLTPFQTIQGYLATGFNGAAWTGNGINSSSAATIAASANIHKTALGFAEASTLSISTFGGKTVDGTAVVIGYALSGDANLDGQVNSLDFNALAIAFNSSTTLWSNGNFNYDSFVNALDFNAIATNFGTPFTAPDLDGFASLVPEPARFCSHPRRRS